MRILYNSLTSQNRATPRRSRRILTPLAQTILPLRGGLALANQPIGFV
jgi:hypothetical protein